MRGIVVGLLLLMAASVSAADHSMSIRCVEASGFVDTKVYGGATIDNNYGDNTSMALVTSIFSRYSMYGFDNWDTIGSVNSYVLDSVYWYFYFDNCPGAANISIYEMWKPLLEGSSDGAPEAGAACGGSWYYVDGTAADSTWGTDQCQSAHDDGPHNRGDGTGYDRMSTAEDVVAVTSGDDDSFVGPFLWAGAELDSIFRGTRTFNGFLMSSSSSAQSTWLSSEYTTDTSLCPQMVLYYHDTTITSDATGQFIGVSCGM